MKPSEGKPAILGKPHPSHDTGYSICPPVNRFLGTARRSCPPTLEFLRSVQPVCGMPIGRLVSCGPEKSSTKHAPRLVEADDLSTIVRTRRRQDPIRIGNW